jgi:NTE family protein
MQYDMVFEGGGAKGIVFVGALQELEARGHTPARVMGTSAGSIMSTFLSAGYSTDEMSAALNEKKNGRPVFMDFLEVPVPLTKKEIHEGALRDLLRQINLRFVPDILEEKLDDAIANGLATSPVTGRFFCFVERGGFFSGNSFLKWLKSKLNTGTYSLDRGEFGRGEPRRFGEMTLAEFHRATGVDLSLIAADTTESMMLILNHRTAPDCPVAYAVRMSMSVPLLWDEVVWQPEWGKYRGKDIARHTVVDGGMLSNFPIELFLSNRPHVTAVMGEKTTDESEVLGFLIDETMEVPGVSTQQKRASQFRFGQLRTITRISNLLNTMLQAHDKIVIESFERFVIRLPAKGYGTVEFDMSDERRDALVQAGRQAAQSYFKLLEDQTEPVISFGLPSETPVDSADRIAERILERSDLIED